ncbi:hypothetical protein [Streptomyces sp. TRM64462]|uniref:hypothetical protein n=1 Tax=Streptomyces sp. TRM64462 TaxID=2741726 RepID=UPI0015863B06|nr:hypothetical protein [Streptomyces sp. TRM64462]
MFALRKAALAVSLAAATVVGPGVGGGVAGAAPAPVAPEADVAYHGFASLSEGRLDVLVLSRNSGPSSLEEATVRLAFSVPVVPGKLPPDCVWGGDRVVLCSTGALPSDGTRREKALELRTVGTPHEVTLHVDTAWNGGATDKNPQNNDHRVLVPATGDPYVF